MPGRLEGRTALITGAASGIGRESAQLFAAEGANVVVADLDERAGAQTVAAIEATGGAARFVATDVAVGAQLEAASAVLEAVVLEAVVSAASAVSAAAVVLGAVDFVPVEGFEYRWQSTDVRVQMTGYR